MVILEKEWATLFFVFLLVVEAASKRCRSDKIVDVTFRCVHPHLCMLYLAHATSRVLTMR
jgi:hypothetical protein